MAGDDTIAASLVTEEKQSEGTGKVYSVKETKGQRSDGNSKTTGNKVTYNICGRHAPPQ